MNGKFPLAIFWDNLTAKQSTDEISWLNAKLFISNWRLYYAFMLSFFPGNMMLSHNKRFINSEIFSEVFKFLLRRLTHEHYQNLRINGTITKDKWSLITATLDQRKKKLLLKINGDNKDSKLGVMEPRHVGSFE